MSSNVGLSTPRGSGTSGYVQKNLSHPKSSRPKPYPSLDELAQRKHRPREPDAAILEHDRKRRIEVEVLKLRDELEEEGVEEETIDERCDALREELEKASRGSVREGRKGGEAARKLKGYQTHELAEAKKEEQEKLRQALGIREDYEEGGHWKRRDERLREGLSGGG